MLRVYKSNGTWKVFDDKKNQILLITKLSHIAAKYKRYLEHTHRRT